MLLKINNRMYQIISLLQCAILYNQFFLTSTTPLIGNNVKTAKFEDFPFIVSFRDKVHDKQTLNHFCGGALISNRHILTAQHCLENDDPEDLELLVGTDDLLRGTVYDIESWIIYDEWAEKSYIKPQYKDNDIAVVKLKESVDDPNTKIVSLSKISESDLIGKTVITVGWGTTGCEYTARYLQKVSLNILTDEECSSNIEKILGYKPPKKLPENKLCTNTSPYALLSKADSGGPVLYNNELVGVNDSTTPDLEKDTDDPREQNLHVKVRAYRDFITSAIQIL